MNQKPVPHNIEVEQALLGAILINNDAYHRVNQVVRAEHFYEPIHRQIFEVIEKAAAVGKTITPALLKAYLPDELLEGVTFGQYLARLAAEATTIVNAPDFAQAIFDDAVRRRLMEIAQRAEADASKADIDLSPRDIIEDTEKALYELAETGKTRGQVTDFREALTDAVNMVAAAYGRDGSLTGLATGLTDLDRLMGGLQASDLIVLAARPGMGKTSLATNIAFNVANSFLGNVGEGGQVDTVKGGRVLFFSLEMSAEQLATRILSEQSGISSSDLRRGNIHENQYGDLVQTANRLSIAPLHIDDTGGQNIAQLAATARRQKRNKGLDLIIVDYIQLLYGTTRKSNESRVQEITEITTKLKALAKELDVPVLALSQLSRAVETREDKHPQLSDLRESGSIEQDADVVLFVYREEYYLTNKEPKEGTQEHLEWNAAIEAAHGKAEVIIAKQRHGPTGIINLHFDAKLTRFTDPAREDYLPERRA